MIPQHGPQVAQIYQSDLERHLFAPGRRRRRLRARRRPGMPVIEKFRSWVTAGWQRWRQLAEPA